MAKQKRKHNNENSLETLSFIISENILGISLIDNVVSII